MSDTPLTMEKLQDELRILFEEDKSYILEKLLLPIMDKYETLEELEEEIQSIDEEFDDEESDSET